MVDNSKRSYIVKAVENRFSGAKRKLEIGHAAGFKNIDIKRDVKREADEMEEHPISAKRSAYLRQK